MNFWKMFGASLLAWVAGFVGLFFFFIGTFISSLISLNSEVEVVESDSILYINLDEAVVDSPVASPFGSLNPVGSLDLSMSGAEPLTLLNILSAIEQAATDDNIKGIYLYTDGNGSISIANIEELRSALLRFKQSGKFIVSYDYRYSQQNYYLASVADNIVVNPEGNLEWYGTSMTSMFYKGLLDKLNITVDVFRPTACKFKSAVEPFILNKMSDANRQQNQVIIDSIWNSLCEDVAACRGISVENLKGIASTLGATFPDEALKLGIVDAVEHEDYMYELFDSYGVQRNDNGLFNTISLSKYISSLNIPHLKTSVGNSSILEYEEAAIVAIIYADGDIVDGNEYQDGSVYGSRLARELRDARLNDAIKSVVVRVNSPGGSSIASELAWREMTLLQQVKPVVISMGDMAASGGYYISAPADYIFSDKTTITGSIGVFGMMYNIKHLLNNRLGVNVDSVYTSSSAIGLNLFMPMSSEWRKIMLKSVDRVYTTFTSHVAEGRNLPIEEVLKIAEGRIWSGVTAKEIGLVDAIGGINEAVGKAIELADISSNYKLCEYVAPLTPFEEFINSISGTYAKSLGLDYNIYGDEIRSIVEEIPFIFTHSGIQTRLAGDIKIEF